MAFWLTLLLWAGLFVIQKALAPRPQRPRDARPAALSDFQFPTAEEGRPIPLIFGTCLVRGPNLGWVGNFSTTPIIDAGVTVGYKYYLGALYLLCRGPVDSIEEVRFSELPVGSLSDSTNDTLRAKIGAGAATSATLEHKHYGTAWELALGAETALAAALGGNWKVTYGFRIEAGRNDFLVWGLLYDGVYRLRSCYIPAGSYSSGSTLAAAIQSAMAAAENDAAPSEIPNDPASYSVSYSANAFHLSVSPGAGGGFNFQGWAVMGQGAAGWSYANTINSTLGLRMDVNTTAAVVDPGDPGATLSLPVGASVYLDRLIWGYGGTNAVLLCTDGAFSARTLLGLSAAADKTLLVAASDSAYVPLDAAITQTTDYLRLVVNAPNLFGTDGGLSGTLDVYYGKETQAASSYLTTQFGTTAPAFQGLCYAVAQGMYIGNNIYPKPPSFVLRRLPNSLGLAGGLENIAGDANPAALIYELLTDLEDGIGLSSAVIDTASFLEAGAALHAEGLGLSFLVEQGTEAKELLGDVLQQIDGVLYSDPYTGLIALRLARGGYSAATVPTIGDDDIKAITITRSSLEDTINVVKVHFVERSSNYTERIAQAMDLANVQARAGDQAVAEYTARGITTLENAQAYADRTLAVVAQPIARVQLTINRKAWQLRQGDPFYLTHAASGVAAMPCRVTRIQHGRVDEQDMVVDAAQDVTGEAWPDNGGVIGLTGWGNLYGYDWGGAA